MKLVAFLATLLFLAPGPVAAQSSSSGGLGGVLDTLGGILGIQGGRVHGQVVLVKADMLVVRTDNGRTVSVDASQVDPRIRGVLKDGDGVTLTLRQPKDGEPRDAAPKATAIELDPPTQSGKTFARVDGTIAEANKTRVTFKTREGFTLPLDVSSIGGLPALSPGQRATLIYEQGRQGPVAVWIEPGAPTIGSTTPTDATWPKPVPGQQPEPSASPNTGLQRVYGRIEAVTMTGFTLASEDGRRVTVDTARVSQGVPDVRPGDLVTVFGRPGPGPDAIAAEFVQAETPTR